MNYKGAISSLGVLSMSLVSTQSSRIRRTFGTLSQEKAADIENLMLRDQLGLTPTIDWDELQKSMRVLIVSEAGTGKTFEVGLNTSSFGKEASRRFSWNYQIWRSLHSRTSCLTRKKPGLLLGRQASRMSQHFFWIQSMSYSSRWVHSGSL